MSRSLKGKTSSERDWEESQAKGSFSSELWRDERSDGNRRASGWGVAGRDAVNRPWTAMATLEDEGLRLHVEELGLHSGRVRHHQSISGVTKIFLMGEAYGEELLKKEVLKSNGVKAGLCEKLGAVGSGAQSDGYPGKAWVLVGTERQGGGANSEWKWGQTARPSTSGKNYPHGAWIYRHLKGETCCMWTQTSLRFCGRVLVT